MKIEKVSKIFENSDYSPEEKNAIKNGYNIGDTVYNNIMKKKLTVVKNFKPYPDKDRETTCTLGAIGENPNVYFKIENKNKLKNDSRVLIEDYDGILVFGYVKDNMYIYDGSTTGWNPVSDIKNWISISELKDKLGWNE